MKTRLIVIALFMVGVMLTSCSNKLLGTWIIQRYDVLKPGQHNVSYYNIGILKIEEDGSGSDNIRYDIVGVKKEEKLPFKWIYKDSTITIKCDSSEFSRTWILLENKKRFQRWRTINDSNQVQILELTKRVITSITINTVN